METEHGEQPLAGILRDYNISNWDLINGSPENISFKQVTRACEGDQIPAAVKQRICNALNSAVEESYSLSDLFNY